MDSLQMKKIYKLNKMEAEDKIITITLNEEDASEFKSTGLSFVEILGLLRLHEKKITLEIMKRDKNNIGTTSQKT